MFKGLGFWGCAQLTFMIEGSGLERAHGSS